MLSFISGVSCPQLEPIVYHYCDDIHLYLPIHILFDSRSAYLGSGVTEKLNKVFSKPWWKKDGTVANNLSNMTYKEVVFSGSCSLCISNIGWMFC